MTYFAIRRLPRSLTEEKSSPAECAAEFVARCEFLEASLRTEDPPCRLCGEFFPSLDLWRGHIVSEHPKSAIAQMLGPRPMTAEEAYERADAIRHVADAPRKPEHLHDGRTVHGDERAAHD